MTKEEKIFLNKKRQKPTHWSKKLDITLDQKEIFIKKENISYKLVLASILENGKNKIFLICNRVKSSKKYELELTLEILKEACKTFRICNNLEEAFKILKNILSKKKFVIKEENEDSMIIDFTIHNCIEYKEEIISFDLERKDICKDINKKNIKENYKNNNDDNSKNKCKVINKDANEDNYKEDSIDEFSDISNNLETSKNINSSTNKSTNKKKKEKEKEKTKDSYSELEHKIKLLFESDDNKETRIRNLIITEGELLYDCYRLKRELKDIKKFIENNEDNIKNIKIDDNKTKDNEEKERKDYESEDESARLTINIEKE
jgi:hypothetical protein